MIKALRPSMMFLTAVIMMLMLFTSPVVKAEDEDLPSTAALHPSVFAEVSSAEFGDYQAKLTGFWNQPAYNGLTNGEAVYDHEWITGVQYLFGDNYPCYNGGWYTDLVDAASDRYDLRFTESYEWWVIPDEDDPMCIDGEDVLTPDLYGVLDLSETCLYRLWSPEPDQTHISSVDLDDCGMLYSADFTRQMYCREFSALRCPNLEIIRLESGAFEKIDIGVKGFDKELRLRSFGPGTVGVAYDYSTSLAMLKSYDGGDAFVGWFLDGELISHDREYVIREGGNFIACFAGDADGNGDITANDALILLRSAVGLSQQAEDISPLDVNLNSIVDAGDALAVLRLSMGLIIIDNH